MNIQKPSPLFSHPQGHVYLHSVFATIQGEGIFAGEPATFIRLVGCNLRCPACDTEYTNTHYGLTSPENIAQYVDKVTAPNKLVAITGGEPFRQNLQTLVTTLLAREYRVQIETNGTLAPTYDAESYTKGVYIMCSPKTGKIHPRLLPHISAYKYVISHTHVSVDDGLPARVLDLKMRPARPPQDNTKPIYIQPMDSKDAEVNFKNLEAAKLSALMHGYTLCLQIHKIIDVE